MAAAEPVAPSRRRPGGPFLRRERRERLDHGDRVQRSRLRRLARRVVVIVVAVAAAMTMASFGYNAATNGQASRPSGLSMINAGGFDTRYRAWGTAGSAIVLVPGAFETADTFASLGAVLGQDHRVFAIDLSGTGYSRPSAPFNASHLAGQLLAFLAAKGLTGAEAPVLVGHSSGAAVVGMAVLSGSHVAAGIVFLDGDAHRLGSPVVYRLAADQSVPDDDSPARAQIILAHQKALRLPVRAGLPAAQRGGCPDVAPPA